MIVPVLSLQMTVALPRVSTAGSRRTTARAAAIRRTPIASTAVTIAGRPSGMAATARATPNRNMLTSTEAERIPSSITPETATTTQMASTRTPSWRPTLASSRWSGVASSVAPWSMEAMPPMAVSMPVATTTAVPRP